MRSVVTVAGYARSAARGWVQRILNAAEHQGKRRSGPWTPGPALAIGWGEAMLAGWRRRSGDPRLAHG
ncbi:MAG: hypothetical protein JRI23_17645 [Deltaproteobacteria bacterium]|nr:hypothetical protein [Deltaproteobacteria bacterium]MBW2533655.1 hypothetical protein [Deltaproteobacteria bacterium]